MTQRSEAINVLKIQDIEALRTLLVDSQRRIHAQDVLLSEKDTLLSEKEALLSANQKHIERLNEQLAILRRLKFGRSSEHFNPDQLSLFDETVSTDMAALEQQIDHAIQDSDLPAAKPRIKPVRKPLPEHLPREDHIVPALCSCPQCGSKRLHPRGEEVSEKLAVKPIEVYVKRTTRVIMSCRDCDAQSYPATPAEIIDGGMADASLLAQILIDKYVDHLPLYRLCQRFARSGVELSLSSLSEWVGKCGVALQPLCDRLKAHLQTASALQVDETPVRMLNAGAKNSKDSCQHAYLFAYRMADLNQPSIVLFDFQSSRKGIHAEGFLGDYAGALVVDDFAGYKRLFECSSRRIVNREIACFAHARRKFFDLHQANKSELASEALNRIGELYALEREAKDWSVEDRHRLRQRKSRVLLDALMEWLKAQRPKVSNGSGTANAMDYLLRREASFRTFLEDGRYPIDNNAVENAIRPIALGRKNWLFAGSERAGKRAAAIMSLLATAKAQGVEPFGYLSEVLTRLPSTKQKDIDTLLPMAFVKTPAQAD